MSSTAIVECARWMEYDADNECIIGFNDDGNENYLITGNAMSFKTVNLFPISFTSEYCGDSYWVYRKEKKEEEKRQKAKAKNAKTSGKSKSYATDNTKNTKNLRLEMKVDPISPMVPYYNNNGNGTPNGNNNNTPFYPQQHPRTPSPVSPQSPAIHNGYNGYNNINYKPHPHTPPTPGHIPGRTPGNNGHGQFPQFPHFQPQYVQNTQHPQQQQQNGLSEVEYKTGTDIFDIRSKHRGLTFGTTAGDTIKVNSSNADTVTRSDEHNGQRYETYGVEIVSNKESYSWNFILHGKTNMIVGLINAEINGQQTLNHYFDTESKIVNDYLYKNGKPKEGMVIEIMYNVRDQCMIVKNICGDSKDEGNSYIFKENINTKKKYRLSVLLDKPGTVTMF
mmetsp:Transcript_446/g.368  ORF Transcript_446/g.368 Transcript_446/m.368 type:complete len:392 (-) Transcript_446:729-1904(-)